MKASICLTVFHSFIEIYQPWASAPCSASNSEWQFGRFASAPACGNAAEPTPTGLEMILSFGNDIEVLVELHVVALPIATEHASHFIFIGLDVQLVKARASGSAKRVDDLGYLVQ